MAMARRRLAAGRAVLPMPPTQRYALEITLSSDLRRRMALPALPLLLPGVPALDAEAEACNRPLPPQAAANNNSWAHETQIGPGHGEVSPTTKHTRLCNNTGVVCMHYYSCETYRCLGDRVLVMSNSASGTAMCWEGALSQSLVLVGTLAVRHSSAFLKTCLVPSTNPSPATRMPAGPRQAHIRLAQNPRALPEAMKRGDLVPTEPVPAPRCGD
jgi:hypothetical protein